jgi:hypothetical protein
MVPSYQLPVGSTLTYHESAIIALCTCRSSRYHCLANGCQCCKNARNLKNKSEACQRKIRSITILLCVVQSVHANAAKTSQKRRLFLPVWTALGWRNPAKSGASQSSPSASRTKLHNTRAVVQEKRMWVCLSRAPQRGHNPSPEPFLLSTSVPEGWWSLNNCHTKKLIFKGRGAFHKGATQAIVGLRHNAW